MVTYYKVVFEKSRLVVLFQVRNLQTDVPEMSQFISTLIRMEYPSVDDEQILQKIRSAFQSSHIPLQNAMCCFEGDLITGHFSCRIREIKAATVPNSVQPSRLEAVL